MLDGYFFILDRASQPDKGLVVFRYLPVYEKEDDEPYFPVYVVLSRFSIDFYYHGFKKTDHTDDSGEDRVNINILHLPLSMNLAVKDNLTRKLKNVYHGKYNVSNEYIYKCDYQYISYWNLKPFIESDFYKKFEKQNSISFRKLLLDFLFDFEHSTIFENAPCYEEVEVHLKENFFFASIAAKAEYYYDRASYHANRKDKISRNVEGGKENLVESELQWLNVLRQQQAPDLHHDGNGWFKNVEDEYRDVLFKRGRFDRYRWRKQLARSTQAGKEHDQTNCRILRESAKWFLRRYSLWDAFKTILSYHGKIKLCIIALCLPLIVVPVYAFKLFSPDTTLPLVADLAFAVWYTLCGLVGSFLLFIFIFNKFFLPAIGLLMPRLIMAISSAWLIFVTTEELVKVSFSIGIDEKSWVLLLMLPVLFFMAIEIKNLAPDISPRRMVNRIIMVIGISFIYSLFIGILSTHFVGREILAGSGGVEEYYSDTLNGEHKENFDFKKDTARSYRMVADIFDMRRDSLNESSFQQYRSTYRPFVQHYEPADTLKILQKLSYVHSRYVKKESRQVCSPPDMLLKVLASGRYDTKQMVNYLDMFKVGEGKTHHVAVLIPIFNNSVIVLFPGMLIFRSIFALFVGIFIQLIFEDKPITEPL